MDDLQATRSLRVDTLSHLRLTMEHPRRTRPLEQDLYLRDQRPPLTERPSASPRSRSVKILSRRERRIAQKYHREPLLC